MINIKIKKREIFIPSSLIAVALSKRATFREQVQQVIDTQNHNNNYGTLISVPYLNISESTLRRIIEKYSEQAVYRPIDDMRYYFQYAKRAFIEPGYPPLFYSAIIAMQLYRYTEF